MFGRHGARSSGPRDRRVADGRSDIVLSTVAIQNATANRFVSAAGTLANCVVGAIALLLLRRGRKLTAATYFVWLFAAFNLLNSGYLVISAVLNSGDWANVIAGLSPPWVWRLAVGAAGVGLYAFSIRAIAISIIRLAANRKIALAEMQRLVIPAYVAAGAVMTIASVFNPISPSLILLSGAGASFGLNAGLLFVPAMVTNSAPRQSANAERIPRSLLWPALAATSGGIFIAVLGPGIHFAQ